MKASKLKTIALIIWGLIVGVSILLFMIILTRQDITLPAFTKPQTTPVTPSPTYTVTYTPSPAIVYLPFTTARAATDMPVTATATPGLVIPFLQYSLTLQADFNPLTGLRPDQPELLNRRPMAVKVSTFPRGIVRPNQYGLTHADLVYEYYIEDGLTRFIAVFYSHDASRAGPVRSGRYFDEYVMRMYRSSLVFANADERVEKHLLESELKPLLFLPRDDNCPPLCRDTTIEGYNNVYVDTAGVGPKLTDNSRQDLRATLFGALMYPLSLPVINRISTHYSIYSYNYWEYDPRHGKYLRYSDAADATSFTQNEVYLPHIDHLNDEQLKADNVVLLLVPHIFHNEYDREDQLIDITLNGSNDAYIFRDGRMIKGKWIRDAIDQPIRLEDEHGQPVPLKPGNTYFQVIDPESTIQQDGENMDFRFFIPLRKVTSTPTPFGFKPSATPRKRP
jgi:hypothetical protein